MVEENGSKNAKMHPDRIASDTRIGTPLTTSKRPKFHGIDVNAKPSDAEYYVNFFCESSGVIYNSFESGESNLSLTDSIFCALY